MDWKVLILCIGCFSLLRAKSISDQENASAVNSFDNETNTKSSEKSSEEEYDSAKINNTSAVKEEDDDDYNAIDSDKPPSKSYPWPSPSGVNFQGPQITQQTHPQEYGPIQQPPGHHLQSQPQEHAPIQQPSGYRPQPHQFPSPLQPQLHRPQPQPQDYHPQPQEYPPQRPEYRPSPLLRDLCPPAATSCPLCISSIYELPSDICRYPLVLRVLLLGAPSVNSYEKVCRKFGVQEVFRPVSVNQFRRVLKFSLNAACVVCKLTPSREYMLISDFTGFTKDGCVFNKVALSRQSVLLSVDRYTKQEILQYLQGCFPPTYNPPPYNPHKHSPVTYNLGLQLGVNRGYLGLPPPPLPTYHSPPPPFTLSPPPERIIQPASSFLTSHASCPPCVDLGTLNLNDFYCKADFAMLAVISTLDVSYSRYGNSVYETPECSKLSSKIIFDISKGIEPKSLSLKLDLLLPASCQCFPANKGPAVVMILGKNTPTPTPPAAQLSKDFKIILIPAPNKIVVPSCNTLSTPYVPPPVVQPRPLYQPYSTINCPENYLNSCPVCASLLEKTLLPLYCSAGFAAVVSVAPKGPVVYGSIKSLPIPDVSVETYYDGKRVVVIRIGAPPVPSREEGTLIIERMIQPADYRYALPSYLTYFVISSCSCPLLQARW